MFGSFIGFGRLGTSLIEFEAPPVLETCYIPLRIATRGLMSFVGTLGLATDGLLDLPCTEAPVDAWREIIRFDMFICRNVGVACER